MELLSQIPVYNTQGKAVIQLLQGDLSAIPAAHAADILIMSAFPGDYTALKGSLMLALLERGLSVKALAADKETDLRQQLDCWMSKPLAAAQQQQFNFKRILCFEPGEKIKEPAEVVGDIFRCINTFAFDEDKNDLIMPIIGTGYQKTPLQKMLPALLKAAYFWLQHGLPVNTIKLVVHRKEQEDEALELFRAFKNNVQRPHLNLSKGTAKDFDIEEPELEQLPQQQPEVGGTPASHESDATVAYDYFLSYAHVHAKDIQYFVNRLKAANSNLRIFYDKDSIPPGGMWIQQISAAIQKAGKVLVFLSPDYDRSPVCWDEFQCAKLLEYNLKKRIIQTIYLYGHTDTPMPLIMGIYSYIDCREGSTQKLDACITQLLQ